MTFFIDRKKIVEKTLEKISSNFDALIISDYSKLYSEDKDEIWTGLKYYSDQLGYQSVFYFVSYLRGEVQRDNFRLTTALQFKNLLVFCFLGFLAFEREELLQNHKSCVELKR